YQINNLPSFIQLFKADGTTPVVISDYVTAAELQGLRYKTVADANGGPAVLSFVVADDGSPTASLQQSISVTVTAVNDAPVLASGTLPTSITVAEDSHNDVAVDLGLGDVSYSVGPADESGQTLTYQINNLPSFIQLFKADGTTPVVISDYVTAAELQGLKYKTVADANGGPAVLSFVVADDGSPTASLQQSISVTVTAVNDAPVLASGTVPSSITVDEDTHNDVAIDLGLGGVTYSPGPANESGQTLTYQINNLPSFIHLYQADGTTPVLFGNYVSATELQGLKFKTVAGTSGGPSYLTYAVTDDGSPAANLQQGFLVTVVPSLPIYDFSAATYSASEGNSTNTITTVTILRSNTTSIATAVDVILTGGSATAGVDFTAGPITVSFAANETSKTVLIEILGDASFEFAETVTLSLANFTNNGEAGTTQPTAVLTISNDDSADTSVAVVGADLVVTDINGGTSNDQLTLSLNGNSIRVSDPSHTISAGAGATQVDLHTVDVPLAAFTGQVIVNALGGDDTINLEGLSLASGQGLIVDGGAGSDTVNFQSAPTSVTGSGAVTVTADTIVVDQSLTTASGGVSLTSSGNLTVNTGVAIDGGTGAVALNADVTSAGVGDDGTGTLAIHGTAAVYGTSISLRGADAEIAGTATVGHAASSAVSTFATSAQGLWFPNNLAFDASGNLYASNSNSVSTITRFTPAGSASTFIDDATNLQLSQGMAFDSSGNFYVVRGLAGSIAKYSSTGSLINPSFATGLTTPQGLTIDSADNLYVSETNINTITKITPGGVKSTLVSGNGINGPYGLTIGPNGDLYVANFSGNTISKVTFSAPGVFGSIDSNFVNTGLALPHSLAFDPSGNLYVTNYFPYTVSKVTFASPGVVGSVSTYHTGNNFLTGLASDSSGALYIASNYGSYILKSIPTVATNQVTIRSSLPSRAMSLGGTNSAVSGINLTDAELARIVTASDGTVTIGDSSQTGNITFTTATPATTAGAATVVVQSTSGGGRIVLDDASGAGTALSGNGGSVSLTAGTAGIGAASANNSAAEISTTGAAVTLNTTGPVGTAANRIQFADNSNAAQQIIAVGSANQASGVYLDSLGSLTLGSVSGATANTALDVTARTNLVVAGGASIATGTGAVSLGADLTAAGAGDNGSGLLTTSAGASVASANSSSGAITLRGADLVLAGAVTASAGGQVNLLPSTANRTIDLGATGGAGQFVVTDSELDLVTTTNRIVVGATNAGNVVFTGPVNMANASSLEVISGGTVNDTGSGTVFTGTNLAITAAQGIGTTNPPLNIAVSNLEASGGTGGVNIANTGNLVIGGVNATLTGLSATNAAISISTTGSLTANEPIASAGGAVNLTAANGVTLSGAAADVTTGGGAFTVNADSDANGTGNYSQDNAGSAVSTSGGAVSVTAADTVLTGTINSGAGNVSFLPSASGTNIIFGESGAGSFATGFGGAADVIPEKMTVDPAGNVYTIGRYTGSGDFDPGTGVTTLTSNGGADIYVTKMDSSGNLIWARSMGGSYTQDWGDGIGVDGSGNVYLTGYFQGSNVDFDPGAGTFLLSSAGSNRDAVFISKLDSSGNFVWARQFSNTTHHTETGSLRVDAAGNVYSTGEFGGTVDFDPGAGVQNLTAGSSGGTYISKLDSNGNYVWAQALNGSAGVYDLALDGNGNIFIGGAYSGTMDVDPGAGTTNITSASGLNSLFVVKLNSSGGLVWGRTANPSGHASIYALTVDGSGNVYSTGSFQGTGDFDPGAGVTNLSALSVTPFLWKLNGGGDFVWAKQLGVGNNSTAIGRDIAVDAAGNVYSTGSFTFILDFDPGSNTFELNSQSLQGGYISKLDANGDFVWAKKPATCSNLESSTGFAITVDSRGNVITAGNFSDRSAPYDFDPGAGTYNISANGVDGFVLKLDGSGNFLPGPAGFALNDAELDNVTTTGKIVVGNATAGSVSFSTAISMANASTLEIVTGGSVNDTGNTTVFTDTNLAITAALGVGTTSPLNLAVSGLEASGGSGGVNVVNVGDVTIGGVSSALSGVVATNAGVTISTTGAMTLAESVASNGGAISLSATGNLTVNTGVTVNSASGAVTLGADAATADGSGTLTLTGTASVYGASITLQAADTDIASTANVGSTGAPTITSLINGSPLTNPLATAFDAYGNLYIADGGHTIAKVTFSSPGVVSSTSTFVTLASNVQPQGLAFDSAGNLYFSDYFSDTISKISFSSPGVLGSVTSLVSNSLISNPFGLAFDSSGNLYVANAAGGKILQIKFSAPGVFSSIGTFTADDTVPVGLAFDASGNLYVSNQYDGGSGNIKKITFASPGVLGTKSVFVTNVANPYSLAFDSSGNLFASSLNNHSISKITPAGVASPYVSAGGGGYVGLSFDSSGILYYVVNSGAAQLWKSVSAAPATNQVTIRSSLPSRAMSLGGTNSAVSGINLTDAELARIVTASDGTVTIGDSSQTGNITFTTATPATTAGAATVVVQSTSGGGRIVLDNASGTGTALNGNSGSVNLTAGTGGIVEAATNTAGTADLGGATAVSLTSAGAIGTASLPLQLGTTNLTSSTAANSSNQFLKATGAVTINAGGLNAGSGTVELDGGTFTLGGSQRINDNTQVTVNGATFALGTNSETVNTLTLISGTVTGSSGVLTSTNTIQTRAGSIGAILAGTNGLTKSTASTVTLSGANTYTGVTAVNTGRLNVNGSLADGPDAIDVTVAAGATLGGTGTINGVVSNSGTTAPGNSPGILNTGSYTFANDSIFEVELGGTTAGNGTNHYDQLNVSGTVTLGTSVTLNLSAVSGFVPAAADSFVIVNNDSNDAVSGTFGGLAEGTVVTVGGRQKKITYVGGDGNDIAIVALDAPVVTVAAPNVVYNGQAYAATGTVTGVSGVPGNTLDGVGLTFTYYLGTPPTGSPVSAPTNVGTYTVVASFAGSTSYVAANSTPATFDITARTLTVSATGINKTYDATTAATVTLSDDRVAGDVFTTETYASATFDTKNVGTGKTVSVSGIAISGGAAGNYTVNTTAQTTADVTRATLVGSITADDKVYDATSAATITGRSLSGVLLSDDVSYVGGTATFNNKNVGVGKTVTATGLSLSGTDADNYTVNDTATDLADITAATLVGSITANNKTYNGLDTATIATRTLSGVLLTDDVTYTGGSATFDNKNVGVGKTVTGTGLGLSGADAGNYTVNSTATTTADVTLRTLTVTATGVNKVYDTTTSATVTLSDDRVAGD
ncbi:MAG: YDG domain-containing protein, partial [Planctomycetota bacterium]|nr:YDG domain-containing protein [Planctomycetota bacterium]